MTKENERASTKVPFRHYITLTTAVECFIRGLEYRPQNWKGQPGGPDEYVGEFRGPWKRGGPNINSINGKNAPNDINSAANECGILYPTTMLWGAYGTDFSNMVQPQQTFG